MNFLQEGDTSYSGSEDSRDEVCDAEILDELTTSRGELKLRTVSFNEDRSLQVYI